MWNTFKRSEFAKKVKNVPKTHLQRVQEERIVSIVRTYEDHVQEKNELEYIKTIEYNIRM